MDSQSEIVWVVIGLVALLIGLIGLAYFLDTRLGRPRPPRDAWRGTPGRPRMGRIRDMWALTALAWFFGANVDFGVGALGGLVAIITAIRFTASLDARERWHGWAKLRVDLACLTVAVAVVLSRRFHR